jgi:hypothetical protein
MANEASKLYNSQKQYKQAIGNSGGGAGPEIPAGKDSELLNKSHDRSYNPVDDAKRGTVATELNADAGRYRKGPGPF